VLDEGWSVASGTLTPTQRLRRAAVAERHAEDIERLYAPR
jgi:long-subunit acyl-CoA synthetase (AMP-forming)